MKSWPWYGYLILAAIIFGLVFAFFFKPRNTELQKLKADRQKIEQEVQVLKAKKLELDKVEADLAGMSRNLKELEVIIPQKKEISDILRKIQQLAFDSRLNITKFAPKGETRQVYYAEWPIPIEVTGNYHNLAAFFDRLSRFSRIFNVENVSIRSSRTQTDALTISSAFTAKTYFFLEEPVVPADTKAKPGVKQ
jgi:type IV pilus assembly protein PilO